MTEKILVILLSILFLNGCASPPDTAMEPPCTRSEKSFLDGQSFVIEHGTGSSYVPTYYRYNKAMWASYNQFVPKETIDGKKATVMCYEVVPGPSNIYQSVVALRVEGITEIIYANSADVVGAMAVEKNTVELQETFIAFKSLIGKRVWSKPGKYVHIDQVDGMSKSTSLKNLEELVVHNVTIPDVKGSEKYIRVLLRRKSNEIVYAGYPVKGGTSRFNLDWHENDPRDVHKDWSEEVWSQIEEGEVKLGMTSAMVSLAIGSPNNVNTTETQYDTRSQWLYKSFTGRLTFYYFKNDVLEAIQD